MLRNLITRLRYNLRTRMQTERGAAAVEFAIGSIVLVTLALGSAEYGLTLQKTHTVGSAIRQGARVASTPCVPSADCKTGNRAYDDYYILRAIEGGLGQQYWKEVNKVVIYKIVGKSQIKGDGSVPPECLAGSLTDPSSSHPIYCNTYTKDTAYTPLAGGTPKKLLSNLDAFETATGADNTDELKAVFGAGTDCNAIKPDNTIIGPGLASHFCPSTTQLRTRSLRSPSRVGIYIQANHKFLTGMFGSGRTLGQFSAFNLEPHPDDNSTDLAIAGGGPPPAADAYDLMITKDDGAAEVKPNDDLDYSVVVSNLGTQIINGARVRDTTDSSGSLTLTSWTCSNTGGGTCGAASGTGPNLGTVTLPGHKSVTYTVHTHLASSFTGTEISNNASVDMPDALTGQDSNALNNSATDTDIVARPDLFITKDDGVTAVVPGAQVTYAIEVGNLGPGKAVNAAVTDTVPATLSSITWTCAVSAGSTPCPHVSGTGNLSETIPQLPVGDKLLYTLRGNLAASATGTLLNTATVTPGAGQTDGGTTSNNTDSDLDSIVLPNLKIVKTGASSIVAGSTMSYTIVVSNPTPVAPALTAPAFAARIFDSGGVVGSTPAFLLSSVTHTCTASGTTCPGGTSAVPGWIDETADLPIGASLTYTVSGQIPSTTSGALSNTATVTVASPSTDSDTSDNTSTVATTIAKPNLKIASTDTSVSVGPGSAIIYKFTAESTVGSVANVRAVDDLSTFPVSGSWTCAITTAGGITSCPASIPAGVTALDQTFSLQALGKVTFTFTGTINAAATVPSSFSNVAKLYMPTAVNPGDFEANPASPPAPSYDNIKTWPSTNLINPVISIAQWTVAEGDGTTDNNVYRGETVTYTMLIKNNGPGPMSGATALSTLNIPSQLTGLSWTCVTVAGTGFTGGTPCTTAPGSGSINAAISIVIPEGQQVKIVLVGTVSATATAGAFTNTPSATAYGYTATKTAITLTVKNPSVSITKTLLSTGSIGPNSPISYKLVALNSGPGPVNGLTITDNVPTSIGGVTWTCAGSSSPVGTCVAPSGGSGNTVSQVVNLAEGASGTVTLNGTVSATATGSITNVGGITMPPGVTNGNTGTSGTSSTTATPIVVPSLLVTIGNSPSGNVGRGGALTYTVVAKNNGGGTVLGARLQVTPSTTALPAGLTWTCTAAGGAVCPSGPFSGPVDVVADYPAGASLTFTANTSVLSTAPMGTFTTTAALSKTGITTSNATATNTVVGPDISVTKTDGQTNVANLQAVTYTVTVSNAGPGTATGVTVSDPVPTGLSVTSWTCAITGTASCGTPASGGAGSAISVSTASIPVGSTVKYTINGTISATSGSVAEVATVSVAGDPDTTNNTATDTDTVVAPDLGIAITNGVTTLTPGSLVTYTVTATNNGPGSVTGAKVTAALPAGFSGVTWTCTGTGCPSASGSGSLSALALGAQTAGSSAVFSLKGTLSVTATGTITANASIAAPTGITETITSNNSASDGPDSIDGPDLSITKTDGVTSVKAGGSTTYTIVAKNNGPSPVTNASVVDTMSSSFASFSWTCTGSGMTCPTASGTGTINQTVATSWPMNGQLTYTVTANVALSASGTLSNTATVSPPSGVTDPVTGNNSATDNDDAIVNPDLQLTKTATTTTVNAGQNVTFTVTAKNVGTVAVTGIQVNDPLATNAKLSGATWTCAGTACNATSGTGSIAQTLNMPGNSTAMYTVTALVPLTATSSVTNTANMVIPATIVDANASNNGPASATVAIVSPDLSITKSATGTTIVAGTNVTYTIQATNNGPWATISNVVIADTLPATLSAATWTCSAAGGAACPAASGTGGISATIASMPFGSTVTYILTAKLSAAATGTLSNTATVAPPASVAESNTANNTATKLLTIIAATGTTVPGDAT